MSVYCVAAHCFGCSYYADGADKQGDSALALIDEAWSQKGLVVAGAGAYIVPMGRVIGIAGETNIRVIVKPGTNEIISAYPQ